MLKSQLWPSFHSSWTLTKGLPGRSRSSSLEKGNWLVRVAWLLECGQLTLSGMLSSLSFLPSILLHCQLFTIGISCWFEWLSWINLLYVPSAKTHRPLLHPMQTRAFSPKTMCACVLSHFSSVQFSHSVVSDSLQSHELQHARPPCLSPTPGAYPNSCPWSWWCYPIISSSVVPFSSCPQSFPESGSFQVSQLSTSGSQSTGVSAATSVLPMNTKDWSPFGWTGWISLQSKGFSNTTVQKHQFSCIQLSL